MTARCHNDTCTVEWSEVVTGSGPAYAADVQLDSSRSLECVEGDGIGVKLLNEVAAAVLEERECANILRRNASGELHAVIPQAVIQDVTTDDNSEVDTSVELASSVKSPTHSYTNTTGCEALVLVQGSFNLDYAILGPGSTYNDADIIRAGAVEFADVAGGGSDGAQDVVPFNAQWGMRLLANINDVTPLTARVTARVATSGMCATFEGANVYQLQVYRAHFAWATAVDAGDTLYFRGDCFHQGSNQTLNVVAHGSGDLEGLGFGLQTVQVIAFPIGVL